MRGDRGDEREIWDGKRGVVMMGVYTLLLLLLLFVLILWLFLCGFR